jgi:hypothetical protein
LAKKIELSAKKILVWTKKGLSRFLRSDYHESVTHLHEFALGPKSNLDIPDENYTKGL